jgi:hypothetical protein
MGYKWYDQSQEREGWNKEAKLTKRRLSLLLLIIMATARKEIGLCLMGLERAGTYVA